VTMWVIPEDLGNFSPKKEKNLVEQKFTSFGVGFSRILGFKLSVETIEIAQVTLEIAYLYGGKKDLGLIKVLQCDPIIFFEPLCDL
jgi:hypothetical protein